MFNGFNLTFIPRQFEVFANGIGKRGLPHEIRFVQNVKLPQNGFSLRWDEAGVEVQFSDVQGELYARQFWAELKPQLLEHPTFPAFECRDWPDFDRRGFMLDLSRTRVPRMSFLFRLVDQLVKLRFNELQLYTEHTFAYSGQELVWGSSSPMTAEEILCLDRYCKRRGVELVPNQNCFGHMERWLRHPDFHHLAECPNGFIHPHGGHRAYGSVLKPETESLDFVRGLLTELLPNFSSGTVNIGCDEAWELGQGHSRDRAERDGREVVYREFVEQLTEMVVSMGRRPQIWADELMREKLTAHNFPPQTIPVIWGYEPGHPFDEHSKRVVRAGFQDFYVAPGTACWNSASGNLDRAIKNIGEAAQQGFANGATGLLLTSWGDGGHQYPAEMMLPSMAFAGMVSWNTSVLPEIAALIPRVTQLINASDATARALVDLGLWEAQHLPPVFNASRVFKVCLAAKTSEIAPWVEAGHHQYWQSAKEALQRLLLDWQNLPESKEKNSLLWAAEVNQWGVERAISYKSATPASSESRQRWARLMGEYQDLWHRDSRPGGYVESQQTLQRVFDAEREAATPSLIQG